MSRSSGILLHISSLYSNHGIGTLGLPAYDFASFLHKSGQHYWQMLPIGPTGFGDSPYMSYSSFAGNPYFIDLDTLAYQGYLTYDEIQACNFGNNPDQVDFAQLHKERIPLLRKAYARIRPETVPELDTFCEEQKSWLDDYCLYMALREDQGTIPWYQWDQPYKMREPSALQEARVRLHGEIRFHAFLQYLFYLQWEQLRFYLKELKIRLIGDLPIYVPLDSADVWANPEIFQLDEKDHRPEAVSGVPPDYFSEDGQLWGHPLYDWDALKKTGYSWWINRIRHQASLF
ncbi:MAG: 4-alpha-glucanotransferase, partial [Clostridia bacterium]|nr:4-alpha-glucanotransferase [Clostridia bacterium]